MRLSLVKLSLIPFRTLATTALQVDLMETSLVLAVPHAERGSTVTRFTIPFLKMIARNAQRVNTTSSLGREVKIRANLVSKESIVIF